MKAPWSLVPMVFPLAAVVAGILLTAVVPSPLWLLGGLIIAIAGLLAGWRDVTVLAVMLTAGIASALINRPGDFPANLDNVCARYSGVAVRVNEGETSTTVYLKIDSVNGNAVRAFDASVVLASFSSRIRRLDRIALNCRLEKVLPIHDVPDEIDPRALGNDVSGFITLDSIVSISPARGWLYRIQRYRERVSNRIFHVGFADGTAAFVNAVLTGDTSDLDKSDREVFAEAGLSHLLALSGLHVGVISWIVGLILFPLFRSRRDPRRGAIVIAVVWLFAIATGLSASVIRAAIMCTVVVAGTMLRRRHSPFNSLCLAATIILIVDPQSLYSAGFQLTFAAVAAILAFMIPVNRHNDLIGSYRLLLEIAGVPIAATIGTVMISLYHFHRLPIHFFGANVLTAWLLPVLMVVAVIALAFPCKPLIVATDALFDGIEEIARTFSELPGIDAYFYPAASGVVLGVAALGLLIYAAFTRRLAYVVMALTALVGWAVIEWQTRPDDSPHAAYFVRNHRSTDIVVRDSSRVIITTTAFGHEYADLKERYAIRLRRFMSRRGIDSLEVTRDFKCRSGWRQGDTLVVANRRFLLLTRSDAYVPDSWSGHVVISAGFKGDVVKAALRAHADTIIIGADVNARRARRYERELLESGKAVVNLHNSPLSYTSY